MEEEPSEWQGQPGNWVDYRREQPTETTSTEGYLDWNLELVNSRVFKYMLLRHRLPFKWTEFEGLKEIDCGRKKQTSKRFNKNSVNKQGNIKPDLQRSTLCRNPTYSTGKDKICRNKLIAVCVKLLRKDGHLQTNTSMNKLLKTWEGNSCSWMSDSVS